MKTPDQIAIDIVTEYFDDEGKEAAQDRAGLVELIGEAIQAERNAVQKWKNLAAKYSDDVEPLRKACQLALNEFSLLVTTRKDLRQAWDKAKEELKQALIKAI